MSTTIQQNNINLQSVLNTINALEPNSGAGVGICSVIINSNIMVEISADFCFSSIDAEGNITTQQQTITIPAYDSLELSNIICGSIIYIGDNTAGIYNNATDNITILFSNNRVTGNFPTGLDIAFIAPTNANETASIALEEIG